MVDEHFTLTDRLKAVLPNSPSARDAGNLVELMLGASTPPAKFVSLSLLLGWLCPEPSEREATAEEWRRAASEVAEVCDYTSAGQMLELGLDEHALLVDPKPAWQMLSVSPHLVFAGLPPVHLVGVLPSIDFDRATSNAFDAAYARDLIADWVRSVYIGALHAAHSPRFADWSIDDHSIDIDRHPQRLPQAPAWRAYVLWAVEWYLDSLVDANEAEIRAGVDAYCRERGFA